MPNYDKAMLGRKAQELGFNRDSYEKMSRLTEILGFMGGNEEINPLLALKGGTAINLTIFNLPRLSVDIDLDFAIGLSRDETREKRSRINELISRYMSAEGYTLKGKSKNTHALDSFVYSYTNAAGNPDNIKIEINYILRCHVLPTVITTVKTSDAFSDFPVRTLSPVEIFASKIVALSGRAAARDLYDLNNMVFYGLIGEPDLTLLKKCAVFYRSIAGDTKTHGFDFEKLQEITQRSIKIDLFPMIRNAERFDFTAAKERVSHFLEKFIVLNEKESLYLKQFAKGKYEPELLFDDAAILERIKSHPMAAWRTTRTREEQHER
jgi:predicted nucleotidyltransferase component of viral defense system